METTNFGAAATLLFVTVPVIFLIGLYLATADGEKSSFYSDTSKGRLSPESKKKFLSKVVIPSWLILLILGQSSFRGLAYALF